MSEKLPLGGSTRYPLTQQEEEEEEEGKLEEEVIELAKKVSNYRSTLPSHLQSSLSSFLTSHRSSLSLSSDVSSFPGPTTSWPHPLSGAGSGSDRSNTVLAADGGEQSRDEIKLLRDKISSNISTMPKVLKRMNECISRIDKLVSSNETIHPAFKRKKS